MMLSAVLQLGSLWGAETELALLKTLPTGPCTDVVGADGFAVAIGCGNLFTIDTASPEKAVILGKIEGLGDTRQVAVRGRLAFVVSRIDGMFIVDLTDLRKPRIVSHYDTLEKATGIALSGNVAYVANRYYGVEAIDVSDPARPEYLSTFFAKHEVQSVAWYDNKVYAGIWAERKVLIADVSNPRRPRRLGEVKLDGYGDGVAARGNLILAATGHHARQYKREHYLPNEKSEPGYGEGHGLEIIDFSDPAAPRTLSVFKTPPYYLGVPDFWSVDFGGGDRALLCDAHNGIRVLDISSPEEPRVLGTWSIPTGKSGKREAIGGAAVAGSLILAAGTDSNLYVLANPEMIGFASTDAEKLQIIPAIGKREKNLPDPFHKVWLKGFIRHILPLAENRIALAAGSEGIIVLDPADNFKETGRYPTAGFTRHLCRYGDYLYAAEAQGGLSIWKVGSAGTLEFQIRHAFPEYPVLQVESPAKQPYLLLEAGITHFQIHDISDPLHPVLKLSEKGPGLFYGPQIASAVFGNYAAVFWHHGGPYWYDLSSDTPARTFDFPPNVNAGAAGNMAPLADGKALVMTHNGFVVTEPGSPTIRNLPRHRLKNRSLNGVASIENELLVVANPAWKLLRFARISPPEYQPELLLQIEVDGIPGAAVFHGDWILFPNGREGLVYARKSELKLTQAP